MCRRSSKGLSNNTNSYECLKERSHHSLVWLIISSSKFRLVSSRSWLCRPSELEMGRGNANCNGNGNFGLASKYVLISIHYRLHCTEVNKFPD